MNDGSKSMHTSTIHRWVATSDTGGMLAMMRACFANDDGIKMSCNTIDC